ncbi:MAG: hypothetical protein MZU95_01940 [Desulfomicrobium escambiense]|nr:hypothetical protein [Desulfomicrobium escambiense]
MNPRPEAGRRRPAPAERPASRGGFGHPLLILEVPGIPGHPRQIGPDHPPGPPGHTARAARFRRRGAHARFLRNTDRGAYGGGVGGYGTGRGRAGRNGESRDRRRTEGRHVHPAQGL